MMTKITLNLMENIFFFFEISEFFLERKVSVKSHYICSTIFTRAPVAAETRCGGGYPNPTIQQMLEHSHPT
jgi:hypothetical protein